MTRCLGCGDDLPHGGPAGYCRNCAEYKFGPFHEPPMRVRFADYDDEDSSEIDQPGEDCQAESSLEMEG